MGSTWLVKSGYVEKLVRLKDILYKICLTSSFVKFGAKVFCFNFLFIRVRLALHFFLSLFSSSISNFHFFLFSGRPQSWAQSAQPVATPPNVPLWEIKTEQQILAEQQLRLEEERKQEELRKLQEKEEAAKKQRELEEKRREEEKKEELKKLELKRLEEEKAKVNSFLAK